MLGSFLPELRVDSLWSGLEVSKQGRTQPSFDVQVRAVVPVSTHVFAPPLKGHLVARKRHSRKQQGEPLRCVWNVVNHLVDDLVCAGHKWLLHQAYLRVIKDPETFVLVRVDRDDG